MARELPSSPAPGPALADTERYWAFREEHGDPTSRILVNLGRGDIGVQAASEEETERILKDLKNIPVFHMVHKNIGSGSVSDLRALATAIAGREDYTCAFQRKIFEKKVFLQLQQIRLPHQKQLLADLDIHEDDPGQADVAKEVLERAADGQHMPPSIIRSYLNYWAEQEQQEKPRILLVRFDSTSRCITKVTRVQSGAPPCMAFRRVDEMHLQAYAPAIDLSDISFDGQPETSQELLLLDPRVNDSFPDHLCHRSATDSCFALNKRNVVKGAAPTRPPGPQSTIESKPVRETSPRQLIPLQKQPRGPGEWRFASEEMEQKAVQTLSNTVGFTPEYPPTALAVRQIRLGDPNFAPHLDLIWVAEDPIRTHDIAHDGFTQDGFSRKLAKMFLTILAPEDFIPWSLKNLAPTENLLDNSLNIDTWFKAKAMGSQNGSPLPLAVIIVIGLNDFLCQQSNVCGRLCHVHQLPNRIPNCMFVFFADRAWSTAERGMYRTAQPLQRMQYSKATTGWHWKSPNTQVLAIAVVAMDAKNEFTFPLSSELYFPGLVSKGPLLLLCTPNIVFLTNVAHFADYDGAQVKVANGVPVALTWQLTTEVEASERAAGRCYSVSEAADRLSVDLSQITRDIRDGDQHAGAVLYKWEWVIGELQKGRTCAFAPSTA